MNQLENVLPWELHSPNALLSASILKYKPNGEGLLLGEVVLNIAFIVKHDGVTALQPHLIILRDARLLWPVDCNVITFYHLVLIQGESEGECDILEIALRGSSEGRIHGSHNMVQNRYF